MKADESILGATELKDKNILLKEEQEEKQYSVYADFVDQKTLRDNLQEDTTELK